MRQHLLVTGVLWAVFTALAVVGAAVMDPFPTAGAEEAHFFDHAFRVLTYMAAPVFGFVVATLVYAVLRFRVPAPGEDGPAFTGTGALPKVWVGATTALCAVVIVYPGLTGLAELRNDRSHELEIDVTGYRWAWAVKYPDGFTVADELVLPVGQRVKFNVTAPPGDVLHSFWVPAFRTKIDAVPGHVTHIYVTPSELGDGAQDAAFRLQCAELCGLFHAGMRMAVRVVTPEEYAGWVAEKAGK